MLLDVLLYAKGISREEQVYLTDNPFTECAYYPKSNALAVINGSGDKQTARVLTLEGALTLDVPPYGCVIREI
jgi:beta-D-galactosyl-(1->4)-L-rhamnose phosphorylase